ncbi:MAG: ZIP family metal transporter [bacterium]
MTILFWAIGATLVVSLISLIGIFFLSINDKFLKSILFCLVGLSAGALMGGAFLHLIPESVEEFGTKYVFIYLLAGFMLFFVVERILKWRHCHEGHCSIHTFTKMSLIGDGVHNFIDGLIIAASFAVDVRLGIVTTVAVITHEIPQEIGDFAVLVYGGYTKGRALFLNFCIACFAILGAVIGFFLFNYIDNFVVILLPLTAGGFIYIAASDLVPELHKEKEIKKAFVAFSFFVIGIVLMYCLKFF